MSQQEAGIEQGISIDGEMTIFRALELKSTLLDVLAASEDVVLDLNRVTELDTAGIQLLLLSRREAQRLGKSFRIDSMSEACREALHVCNLLDLFEGNLQ